MPVHSIELAHLVLLNIEVQDTSEFVLKSTVYVFAHLCANQFSNRVILLLSTLMAMVISTSRIVLLYLIKAAES